MLGTLVMDGRTYRIARIELIGGQLVFTATGWGPARAVQNALLTVFGSDGVGVCQGWLVAMPEVKVGELITIIAPIRIMEMNNESISDATHT